MRVYSRLFLFCQPLQLRLRLIFQGRTIWQQRKVQEARVPAGKRVQAQRRNRADASTAKRPARKCARRCITCVPASTRKSTPSRAASRQLRLGFRRRGRKAPRFRRRSHPARKRPDPFKSLCGDSCATGRAWEQVCIRLRQ